MAIQTRRGTYNDFDPEKLLPGEWATVQSDDPASADGKSMYMCFAPGEVKRMATYEDMVQNIDSAVEEIKDQFSAGMQQATDAANMATGNATQATSAATTAAERANEVAQTIEEAVQGTIINDVSPSELTVYSSQKLEDDFRKKDDIIDILHGGTGATTAEEARNNLQAAAKEHAHDLESEEINGVLGPSKGGTGKTTLAAALSALMYSATPKEITEFAPGVSATTVGSGDPKIVQIRKVGNLVFLEGYVKIDDVTGNTQTLFNIPSGYAPTKLHVFFAPCSGTNVARVNIYPTGGATNLNWIYGFSGGKVTGAMQWVAIDTMWVIGGQPDPGP